MSVFNIATRPFFSGFFRRMWLILNQIGLSSSEQEEKTHLVLIILQCKCVYSSEKAQGELHVSSSDVIFYVSNQTESDLKLLI